MCGRYVQTQTFGELARRFNLADIQLDLRARYNIAPTQEVPAVVTEGGRRVLRTFRWGLIPKWADGPGMGQHLINARAETVCEKPAFREALRHRRCLIPSDGFYEWQKIKGGKIPQCIRLRSGEPFGFAGLWERWTSATGEVVESCAIITTPANELIARVHDRMPAILRPNDEAAWLDPALTDPAALLPLLSPFPADLMRLYPVSHRVGTPLVDEPSLMDEVQPPPHTQGELF